MNEEAAAVRSTTPRGDAGEPAAVDAVLGVSRLLVAVAARSLADLGEDVTLQQYRALVVLATNGPQRVHSLAAALAVSPSTATRMCDRLVRKGLVRRRAARTDRREVHVTLTGAGRSLLDEVTCRRREEIAALLERLAPGDRVALGESFAKLVAAGSGRDPGPASAWEL